MTGEKVFERALLLLNYTDPNGEVSRRQNAELYRRAVPILNEILADVLFISGGEFTEIEHLGDELPTADAVAMRVMPYGVAMLLSQSEGDGDNQQLMAAQYNALRGSVPRATESIQDALPCVTA